MSAALKWTILIGGLLMVSMGIAMLRNALAIDEAWIWSLATGVICGGGFFAAGKALGLFRKRVE